MKNPKKAPPTTSQWAKNGPNHGHLAGYLVVVYSWLKIIEIIVDFYLFNIQKGTADMIKDLTFLSFTPAQIVTTLRCMESANWNSAWFGPLAVLLWVLLWMLISVTKFKLTTHFIILWWFWHLCKQYGYGY